MFVKQCSIHGSRAKYIWEKNKLQVHLQNKLQVQSPDEWATTKQACRDELVVYLFFSPIYIYIYIYLRVGLIK